MPEDGEYISEKSYSEQVEELEEEWSKFRRALKSKREKMIFDEIWLQARLHEDSEKELTKKESMKSVLMSVILEQQVEIKKMKEKVDDLKKVGKI